MGQTWQKWDLNPPLLYPKGKKQKCFAYSSKHKRFFTIMHAPAVLYGKIGWKREACPFSSDPMDRWRTYHHPSVFLGHKESGRRASASLLAVRNSRAETRPVTAGIQGIAATSLIKQTSQARKPVIKIMHFNFLRDDGLGEIDLCWRKPPTLTQNNISAQSSPLRLKK